ncbi:MATE family efflux transporter [Bariatricus massiliensis]|uniref:Probable multidrug resistance protein NorM n=1 Tax=Bariatricus massiliensis TaxID=1745713 RepID=A0ABS8DL71_9FIRM|nr:MATE family efflux transporter [Bariatricus massiliensis]MCB7305336.1 MATE family efflux transporter [Bariatricus massiliensis]MCB7375890.1 MATE family efflux transporter [Bariatricus massiliensis]MCB7388479.1 MATE family efflux transporter [Bariatricus massiliensis]MCB7412652.1 MATE family efflux transporter [Bariatricus massiliensis]MCQ5252070.1 MATE family efflux transporter [Bariatricus massiliensis]
MSDTSKENKMGVMPIPKLLITMSLPMIISMLVQALYNIVDSMFVAKLNEEALTAVSLAFPIQNLMIAVAAGTGVGINALLSRNLGERRFDDANLAAKNGLFLGFISSVVFAIVGGASAGFFFRVQTDNPLIVTYGTQYMQIVTILSIGIFMQIMTERLLQATGKTFYTMITQGLGAVINIILDPILIFGLFGFPRLEVAGAAWATVIGQIIAFLLGVYYNVVKNKELNLNMKGFRPNGKIIADIYKVGVPSIIMQSIGSVMTFGMNKILLMFSSTAAAVFGIYFKLQSFIFMPIFGLNNGMIPIIAYNYGARQKKRIMQTIRLSVAIAMGIMAVGLAVFQLKTASMLNIFDASEHMLEIGIPALRIISLSFIFAGFCIIVGSVFQALGNGVYSLIISVARQLLVILPVAYAFASLFGLHMVWWAIPIAELVSLTLSALLLRRIYRLKIKNL